MPGATQSMKGQLLGVINAVSYMRSAFCKVPALSRRLNSRFHCGAASKPSPQYRFFPNTPVPLTAINLVVIFTKLIFG